ncbi:MAG: zinc ribbon domain-containing protein, partial [Thermoplasmata archaeon]|nr:zinc ribbon domain-containing protein [Thermoplasmata archaeon]
MSYNEKNLRNALAVGGTGFALPGDHKDLKAIINMALKSGFAVIAITSSPGSMNLLTGLSADERKILAVIDWETYKTRSIVGVEEESGILYCARNLVNINMAVNKAMRRTSKAEKRVMIVDALPTMVSLFGEIMAYDFLTKNLAKLGAKNMAGVYLAPESFFSDPEMKVLIEPLESIDDAMAQHSEVVGAKNDRYARAIDGVLEKLGISRDAVDSDFQNEFGIWLCFECGAFVDKNTTACQTCGAAVEMVVHTDQTMMKMEELISKCPECGVPVHIESEMCAVCGRMFSEKDKEDMLGQGLMNAVDEVKSEDEDLGFLVCQECGSFVNSARESCGLCGAKIDKNTANKISSEEQVVDELSSLIVTELELDDDLESTFSERSFIMCPECSASVDGTRENCPVCDYGLSGIKKPEIPGPEKDIKAKE